jgi:site-specific recombinase XerD
VRFAMVAGRTGHWPATRPQGEERLAECPPMQGDEIRALRRLQREQRPPSHVFMTERDGPMTPKAFHALFGRIGARAKMPFPIHPHMLRHGCGYALANAGHDTRALQAWLGHKNIQHTVRYTELAPDRFKDFWR